MNDSIWTIFFSLCVSILFYWATTLTKDQRLSSFHYEEQLLQKMVRLEIETEQMKKEMELMKKETEQTKKETEQMKSEMEQKILPTLDDLQKSTVAFSAYDPSNTNPANGEVFVFRNVLLNEGSAYNRNTGVFTAPISGLYHFTVHVCNANTQAVVVAIVHNGHVQAVSTQYENVSSGCGSVSALIRLNVGDNVNVVTTYGSTKMFENVHRRASFIGFRLY